MTEADVHCCGDSTVVLPAAETGYLVEPGADLAPRIGSWLLDECGICAIDRRVDTAMADLFAGFTGARPHVISIVGAEGSGCTTVACRAARVARTSGFVPIGGTMLERVDHRLFKGRQLCVILDRDSERRWRGLLSSVLASPRPHAVLQIDRDQGPTRVGSNGHTAILDRIPTEALVSAVRPAGLGGPVATGIQRAAEASCGLPGRFAALLWRRRTAAERNRRFIVAAPALRVAEQSAVYGTDAGTPAPVRPDPPSSRPAEPWPAPGELAAFRRRAELAAVLLRKGRHAPAVRQLRQIFSALMRRHDWVQAGEVGLTLASALLRRGDAQGALSIVDQARTAIERTGSDAALIDAAVISGHGWIDLTRLDEAESVIATAVAVARRIGDLSRTLSASAALGRCLFWKGQYGDAVSTLAAVCNSNEPYLAVTAMIDAARAEVGRGHLPQAISLARDATERASNQPEPHLIARAAYATAFVHLAAGDLDAIERDVRRSIVSSRAAHDPMVATRARLLLAEGERRGRGSSSVAGRVSRLARLRLPPIIRARVELLDALLRAPGAPQEIVARQASRLGLPALALFGPIETASERAEWRTGPSTDDVVDLLHLCQTADDETRVLDEVCTRVRQQLRAAAVAVVAAGDGGLSVMAADGGRIETGIAARAVGSGLTIAPHRLHDRLEAAAPIRYGGNAIGALAARWPLGTPYDLTRAASLLTMAATMAGPVVSTAMARRSRAIAPAMSELMGVTPQMLELRKAIERAACAPFAILIDGESGSGKELRAKAIHRTGLRRDRPFCTLNCAAIPDDLVEAELFGHARGAFTGAVHERDGVFEEAHGGTLFLDEVGELSPRAQAKLLRVIQEGELRRIGENTARRVDVRIVAATNRELRREVSEGRFRMDLLYRLDVVRLAVPPLRDRRDDIGMLAGHFWREATERVASRAVLAAATLAALQRYDWPGNVRELQNVLAALAVRVPRRGVVTPATLPPQFGHTPAADACRLDAARRIFEERFVRAALVRCGGHRTRAAAELGVTRQGLTKLLLRLNIS
jgi:DNA-binding NtrC family response regulator